MNCFSSLSGKKRAFSELWSRADKCSSAREPSQGARPFNGIENVMAILNTLPGIPAVAGQPPLVVPPQGPENVIAPSQLKDASRSSNYTSIRDDINQCLNLYQYLKANGQTNAKTPQLRIKTSTAPSALSKMNGRSQKGGNATSKAAIGKG